MRICFYYMHQNTNIKGGINLKDMRICFYYMHQNFDTSGVGEF
jgi:hypothetical protein